MAQSLLPAVSAPIRCPPPDKLVFSDSSSEGWGIDDPVTKQKGGGRWSEEEQEEHINILELRASQFALESFCANLKNIHVRLMTDNQVTMYTLLKQGSMKPRLNEIAREIWSYAIDRNIWLSSAYVRSADNKISDEQSRVFNDNIEWTLRDDIFEEICLRFGIPEIDLFASRLNCKVERYGAYHVDPGAEIIDSFNMDWGKCYFYAFPPFIIVHRVIQKCIQDKAEGILLLPDWPSQPWYTVVRRYTVGKPFTFKVTKDELFLPFRSETGSRYHPLCPLKMMAVRLSCKLS